MAGVSQAVSIAPKARIRRDTGSQRRFLPRAREEAGALLACARASEDEATAALTARLPVLTGALLRSPYYRDVLRQAGLSPFDLQRLEDLDHFPMLDRETLGARWRDLPAIDLGAPEAEELVVVTSSGTTGEPVPIVRDRYDCLQMWTVLGFFVQRLGIALPPRPRVVLLDALPGGLEYSTRLPIFRDGALHRISLTRPDALERLRRVSPAIVFSDPEGLRWLAAQDVTPPRLLLSSAQHLPQALRANLAARVPAPVINYYATMETGPLAWECLDRAGRFHVLAPDVWLEPGRAEVRVTRLRPSVLPLLRYRTGDAGLVERDACPCGFQGWTLSGFEGRSACRFRAPDGREHDAWQLAWIFKHHPLRAFRLTQRATERFELELVGAPDAEPLRERLDAALRRLGWARPEVTVRFVESLPAQAKPAPFRGFEAATEGAGSAWKGSEGQSAQTACTGARRE